MQKYKIALLAVAGIALAVYLIPSSFTAALAEKGGSSQNGNDDHGKSHQHGFDDGKGKKCGFPQSYCYEHKDNGKGDDGKD
jgi:hypothetical protein